MLKKTKFIEILKYKNTRQREKNNNIFDRIAVFPTRPRLECWEMAGGEDGSSEPLGIIWKKGYRKGSLWKGPCVYMQLERIYQIQ